jgi:hypothetical protein
MYQFVFFTGGVVFLTLIINGSTTQFLLHYLNMDQISETKVYYYQLIFVASMGCPLIFVFRMDKMVIEKMLTFHCHFTYLGCSLVFWNMQNMICIVKHWNLLRSLEKMRNWDLLIGPQCVSMWAAWSEYQRKADPPTPTILQPPLPSLRLKNECNKCLILGFVSWMVSLTEHETNDERKWFWMSFPTYFIGYCSDWHPSFLSNWVFTLLCDVQECNQHIGLC